MASTPLTPVEAGIRYNGIATATGIVFALCFLPPVGAVVGFFFIQRAKAVENPAILGRIVLFINIILSIALAVVAWQIWESGQQLNQQLQQMQQQNAG